MELFVTLYEGRNVLENKRGILYYYTWAALIAIEVMLAFSAWGYIKVGGISITFVPIVVLATAYLLGPWEGTWAGVIFAFTGMWKASVITSEATYGELIFSPVRSGQPMESVILCFLPRIILGLLAGVLFTYAKRAKNARPFWIVLSALAAQLVHVLLVFGLMQAFFSKTSVKWWTPLFSWHSVGMDIEMAASVVAMLLIHSFSRSAWLKDKRDKIAEGVQANKYARVVYWQWIALGLIAACGLSVCLNLDNGIDAVVQIYDVMPGETSSYVLHGLLLQFIVAQMALFILIGILQSLIYYYYASAEVRSRMDLMTGAFNRTTLTQTVMRDLKKLKKGQQVLFIMLDVDYFKKINDTYGHDFGDRVLITLVRILQRNFAGDALIGRMGGDEFAVYCNNADIKRQLPYTMDQIMHEFEQIVVPGDRIRVLSCSYGIAWGEAGMEFQDLYKQADKDLYEHKHIRARSVDNSEGNV